MSQQTNSTLGDRRLIERRRKQWAGQHSLQSRGGRHPGRGGSGFHEPRFLEAPEDLAVDYDDTPAATASTGTLLDAREAEILETGAYYRGLVDSLLRHHERQLSSQNLSTTMMVCGFEVPTELRHLADEIERSRGILDLEPGWNGAGSPRYSEEVWSRAVGLLVKVATDLWRRHRLEIGSADIVPAARRCRIGTPGAGSRISHHRVR